MIRTNMDHFTDVVLLNLQYQMNMTNEIKTELCNKCLKPFYVQETYGANGSDEYSQVEIGHDFYCVYRNIDPMNRKFVKEVAKV